jgi:hypothetical protein
MWLHATATTHADTSDRENKFQPILDKVEWGPGWSVYGRFSEA